MAVCSTEGKKKIDFESSMLGPCPLAGSVGPGKGCRTLVGLGDELGMALVMARRPACLCEWAHRVAIGLCPGPGDLPSGPGEGDL